MTNITTASRGGGNKFNETNKIIAEHVIRAVDAFLNGTCSADEANTVVDREIDRIDENDSIAGENRIVTFISRCRMLSAQLLGDGDRFDVLETRNLIAKRAGLKG